MRRIPALVTIVFLAAGAAFAQSEGDVYRFEVSVEKGKASVLSGPDIKAISNGTARFGFSPTRNYQLTLSYTKWTGDIASDDILGEKFAIQYNKQFPQAQQRVFRDAVLDKRDIEIIMYEFGLVKTIPLSKHWDSFIGIQIGFSDATADVNWKGAELRTGGPAVPVPSFHSEDDQSFMTSVRGGIRWVPVGWFGVQGSVKIAPIGTIFEENLNSLEVNVGLVFRFGKMK